MTRGEGLRLASVWGIPRDPAWMVMASPVLVCLLLRPWGLAVYAVAATILTVIALQRPAMATLLMIPLGFLSGMSVGSGLVVCGTVAVLLLITGFRVLTGTIRLRPAHLWIGLFAFLLVVSFVFPSAWALTLNEDQKYRLPDLVGLLTGLALLAVTVAAPPHPRILTKIIALTGAIEALYALAGGDQMDNRLQGLTLNPNYLGALLALSIVAAVGLVRHARSLPWIVPAIPCFVAVAQTESRGAFLAAMGGIAIVLIQGRPFRFQVLIALAAGAVTMVFPAYVDAFQNITAGNRPNSSLTLSHEVREQAARFAAHLAYEHPLRGVGYGMFSPYAATSPDLGIHVAVHNDYLRLAAESGVVALAVFFILLGMAARSHRFRELRAPWAVVVAYAVSLLFADTLASLVVTTPFWVALGCLLGQGNDLPSARPMRARLAASRIKIRRSYER